MDDLMQEAWDEALDEAWADPEAKVTLAADVILDVQKRFADSQVDRGFWPFAGGVATGLVFAIVVARMMA